MKKLYVAVGLLLIVALAVGSFGCAKPAPPPTPPPAPVPAPPAPAPAPPKPEPIVLEAVHCWTKVDPGNIYFFEFIDKINERAKGELIIEYKGGAEAIPSSSQPEAVINGVVDMANVTSAYYKAQVPAAAAMGGSQLTPREEREVGFYDLMVTEHKKAGLMRLAKTITAPPHRTIFLSVEVENPREDFKGLLIRGSRQDDNFLKALGFAVSGIPSAEIYTAMERGTIDAFSYGVYGVTEVGFIEVTKYMIDHPYYVSGTGLVMNLDSWDRLPKHLQDLMLEVSLEVEEASQAYFVGQMEQARQEMLEAGVEFITFSPADAKWYLDLAYDLLWEEIANLAPELTPKMREMLTK